MKELYEYGILQNEKKDWDITITNKNDFKYYLENGIFKDNLNEMFNLFNITYVKNKIYVKKVFFEKVLFTIKYSDKVSNYEKFALKKSIFMLEQIILLQKAERINATQRDNLINSVYDLCSLNNVAKEIVIECLNKRI